MPTGIIGYIPTITKIAILLALWVTTMAVYSGFKATEGEFSDNPGLLMVESQALLPLSSPVYRNAQVLGVVAEIIRRESQGNPTAKNPKSTAYGLCQFLDGTWEYVQKKWSMKLDRHDPADQLYACERLLLEEGTGHWKSSGPYNLDNLP